MADLLQGIGEEYRIALFHAKTISLRELKAFLEKPSERRCAHPASLDDGIRFAAKGAAGWIPRMVSHFQEAP